EWTLVGSLPIPIHDGTAARLADGSVLVVRDYIPGVESAAFISGDGGVNWRPAAAARERNFVSHLALADGRFAAVTRSTMLYIYDPLADTWTLELRDVLGAAVLDDRRLLVVSYEYADEAPYHPSGTLQMGPFGYVYD